jgi:hypothetical protein
MIAIMTGLGELLIVPLKMMLRDVMPERASRLELAVISNNRR